VYTPPACTSGSCLPFVSVMCCRCASLFLLDYLSSRHLLPMSPFGHACPEPGSVLMGRGYADAMARSGLDDSQARYLDALFSRSAGIDEELQAVWNEVAGQAHGG
jgi:hypothetical protein